MKIEKIKLFTNNNEKSKKIENELIEKLTNNGFIISETEYDLGIAIGGDGSFLRMIKASNFNANSFFIGVNTGTFGFLQEIEEDEIDFFIEKLKLNEVKVDELSVLETTLKTTEETIQIESLNEVLLRRNDLKTCKINIFVNEEFLEKYAGDGILISSSIGSTAYNLSLGGSIVYEGLGTLQLTPIAPLNTKAYRNIVNSIIMPEDKNITLIPEENNKNLIIYSDGDIRGYKNIDSVIVKISEEKIKCLRLNSYSYTKIINEKFLK